MSKLTTQLRRLVERLRLRILERMIGSGTVIANAEIRGPTLARSEVFALNTVFRQSGEDESAPLLEIPGGPGSPGGVIKDCLFILDDKRRKSFGVVYAICGLVLGAAFTLGLATGAYLGRRGKCGEKGKGC